MKRVVVLIALMCSPAPVRARESWSGKWHIKGSKPVSELRTIDRDGDIEFQLDLWNGPPANASGRAEGHIAIRDGLATYKTTEFGGECQLDFTFTVSQVVVKQSKGDSATCGFGNGVLADGTFVRVSRKTPKFIRR